MEDWREESNNNSSLQVATNQVGDVAKVWMIVLWSDDTKFKLL